MPILAFIRQLCSDFVFTETGRGKLMELDGTGAMCHSLHSLEHCNIPCSSGRPTRPREHWEIHSKPAVSYGCKLVVVYGCGPTVSMTSNTIVLVITKRSFHGFLRKLRMAPSLPPELCRSHKPFLSHSRSSPFHTAGCIECWTKCV